MLRPFAEISAEDAHLLCLTSVYRLLHYISLSSRLAIMLRFTPTTALLRSTTLGLRFSSTTVDPLLTSLRTALKTHMKARDSVKVSVIKVSGTSYKKLAQPARN